MTNRPNTLVITEWLFPIVKEELLQLHAALKDGIEKEDLQVSGLAQQYHDLYGTFKVASLADFATLTQGIEAIVTAVTAEVVPALYLQKALYASEMLLHELTNYVQTGAYRQPLVLNRQHQLYQVLSHYNCLDILQRDILQKAGNPADEPPPSQIDTGSAQNNINQTITDATLSTGQANTRSGEAISHLLQLSMYIELPALNEVVALSSKQRQTLAKAWRYGIQSLLASNSNDATALSQLQLVANFMLRNAAARQSGVKVYLWYLTSLWLDSLALNPAPTPATPDSYVQVLSNLDAVISVAGHATTLSPVQASTLTDEALVAVYLQLNDLVHTTDSAKTVLAQIESGIAKDNAFFPRILSQLEQLIFQINLPNKVITPLKDIKTQLLNRGWTRFEDQLNQILADLQLSTQSEDLQAQLQWQVERQMQDLYGILFAAYQAIDSQIGAKQNTYQAAKTSEQDGATQALAAQDGASKEVSSISQQAMRQARIAVEDIKGAFNEFLHKHHSGVLQKSEEFQQLNLAFEQMGLSEAVDVIDRAEKIFANIVAQDLTHVTWELTDAIADMLVTLEVFMDYLAQQTLNSELLARIAEQLQIAEHYLNTLIDQPEMLQQSLADLEDWPAISNNVTRYDDSGEIAGQGFNDSVADGLADAQTTDSADQDTMSVVPAVSASAQESEELLAARAELKDDDFSMDEDIREIFIEEAGEVLETLDTYLPQWQNDPQNLEPLGEIRRGFHTLKGSGRMVGAFNAGEMAWAVENLLNRVLDKTLSVNDELIVFITETKDLIPTLVEDFSSQRLPSIDPAVTVLKAHNLQKGRAIDFGLAQAAASRVVSTDDTMPADATPVAQDSTAVAATGDAAVVGSDASQLPAVLQPFMDEVTIAADASDADEDIKEIFIEEAQEVLETITPQYQLWQQAPDDLSTLTEIRRGFHTLKGSGRMVGANSSAEVAWAIEDMLNRILEKSVEVTPGIQRLVGDVIAAYPDMVSTFEQGHNRYPDTMPLWIAAAHAYSKKHGADFDYQNLAIKDTQQTDLAGTDGESARTGTGQPDTLAAANAKKGDEDGEPERAKSSTSADAAFAELARTDSSNTDSSNIDGTTPRNAALDNITTANAKLEQAAHTDLSINSETQDFEHIFLEEAAELVASIEAFISRNQNQESIAVDDDIVRAFHTLRGAAGSPSLKAISDMSATVEHSLEQLQQQDEPMSASHLEAVSQSVVLIKKYVEEFTAMSSADAATGAAHSENDTNSHNKDDVVALQGVFDNWLSEDSAQEMTFNVSDIIDDDIDDLLEGEWTVESNLAQSDEATVELFAEVLASQCHLLLSRVKGSKKFTLVVSSLAAVYQRIVSEPSIAQEDAVIDALLAGHEQLTNLLDALAGSMNLKVDTAAIAKLNAIAKPPNFEAPALPAAPAAPKLDIEEIDTDPELLEIFLEEAQEIDAEVSASFQQWSSRPEDFEALKVLQRHLHTIKGGARMSGISSIGDLTHEAETIYEYFVEGRITPSLRWVKVMQGVQDTLSGQIEYVVNTGKSFYAHDLVKQLHTLSNDKEVPEDYRLELPVVSANDTEVAEEADEAVMEAATGSFAQDELAETEKEFIRLQLNSWHGQLPDSDILEVFLEEAKELVESSGNNMQAFQANTSNVAVLQALQRELHTLKGGARMIAATGIADIAHEMENVYEDLASRRRPATRMVSQLLTLCHEWIAQAIYLLENGINPPEPTVFITSLQNFSLSPDTLHTLPKVSLQDYTDAIDKYQKWKDAHSGRHDISAVPLAMGGTNQANQLASQSNEMIRVSSGLIEQMINLSGESAINRARIDMSVTSINNTIDEMGTTVQRLSDQLRRMDIELEAQVLSQIDEAHMFDEGFDPLEMDQYSALNQLSKSLSESASDLLDIKSTILDKTRDTEDLLLQLSRTQAELQDGLMNSRMVPFSRLIPRLQRVVRQTANELDKSVNLEVINADDEMDRTILDRITSPLEHMLRNAVDHGVEMPEEREARGKPATGKIVLDVAREGSEVVIKLSDDGKGINVEAVRKKAISQGLIDKDDNTLTDIDVMQYIFNAGLTTTNKVTQISGRGVGMDVVLSEIRQLGGTVSVESEAGKGSTFAIRVPLTVAISDALVVRVADAHYAIPLIQIERVERVNPEALFAYYQSNSNTFAINGTDYRLRYLNEMLTGVSLNEFAVSTNVSLPVIIVKNQTGQNLAIQVDEVAGARIEVVVKPLGRQLSHIAGLSAATIMGDGSVMLILDILALIRNAPARSILKKQSQQSEEVQKLRHHILVVDDSVTVRKVTSRLLERQGYEVHVARDGVEALEILQDFKPDLMLLDIEMPRMDGFEVATHVRHDSRLRDLAIIMITSRTGDKHRERAMDIGVNHYMGKPFQEAQLVNTIQSIIGVTTGAQ